MGEYAISGTYTAVLTITDVGGGRAAASVVIVVLGSAPATPIGLTARSTAKNVVALAWGDNADNETSYTVERSLNGTGSWRC